MNTPEAFIITIVCASENCEIDMEIPADLPVGEMRRKVLDVLKNVYVERFFNWKECQLMYGNRFLGDEETLLRAGIYDGSYLTVITAMKT